VATIVAQIVEDDVIEGPPSLELVRAALECDEDCGPVNGPAELYVSVAEVEQERQLSLPKPLWLWGEINTNSLNIREEGWWNYEYVIGGPNKGGPRFTIGTAFFLAWLGIAVILRLNAVALGYWEVLSWCVTVGFLADMFPHLFNRVGKWLPPDPWRESDRAIVSDTRKVDTFYRECSAYVSRATNAHVIQAWVYEKWIDKVGVTDSEVANRYVNAVCIALSGPTKTGLSMEANRRVVERIYPVAKN
jgi:hypothetical protein